MATIRSVNALSRTLRLGSGTVLGGRAGLAVDPGLLARLAAGRPVALVSGTNGKTTTTRLLAVALADGDPVVTNGTGANMPAGHVAALAAGSRSAPVVLEVDESYLPGLVRSLAPAAVVLLNLSRDQLDRTNEVRMLANRWRHGLAAATGYADQTTVVANADDPLVAWAAAAAPRVVWVAAGLGWRLDAVGCPACEGRITFAGDHPAAGGTAAGGTAAGPAGGWSCSCGFARPPVDVWLEGDAAEQAGTDGIAAVACWSDGRRLPLALGIPGWFNRANAALAAAGAEALGVPAERAVAAMATVGEVAGRFTVRPVDGVPTRLMLAKNPAGWQELLGLVRPGSGPVVVGINARVADGRDPSWLWDVPFEQLAGRPVVATGERCRDLSVRLRYAGVTHTTVRDSVDAVRTAAGMAPAGPAAGRPGPVEFIGNYTAFADLLARR
ncbi:MAG TPA: MurT ligase domain-containing protein [Acidimicrobiales bacterium]|nr:MurT ligase domain-containing protein [Acidimicrobiales bacterium]